MQSVMHQMSTVLVHGMGKQRALKPDTHKYSRLIDRRFMLLG